MNINWFSGVHIFSHLSVIQIQFYTIKFPFFSILNSFNPVFIVLFYPRPYICFAIFIQLQQLILSGCCSLLFFVFSSSHFHKDFFRRTLLNLSKFFGNLNGLPDCPFHGRRNIQRLNKLFIRNMCYFIHVLLIKRIDFIHECVITAQNLHQVIVRFP